MATNNTQKIRFLKTFNISVIYRSNTSLLILQPNLAFYQALIIADVLRGKMVNIVLMKINICVVLCNTL